MINAMYLAKFYSETIPIAMIYTYGQPPLGSTNFNTWIANCIGPEKIVRVVSQWDLVPFSRVASNVNHPDNVLEAYGYNAKENKWRWCLGPDDRVRFCLLNKRDAVGVSIASKEVGGIIVGMGG